MKLKTRAKLAYNLITNKSLDRAMGMVTRNYAEASKFNPNQQLRGITYKAIDKIGLTLSSYEPQVLKVNGETYINHPFYNVFKQPNPRINASDFIHLYGMLYEIYGETFWYLAKGETSNKVKEIYMLNPAQVELVIAEGDVVGYRLHKSNGQIIPLEKEEVYHDKRPNPFNEWRGMSVMEKASEYIDIEIITSNFTLNYMKNNASPSGIVSLPNMDKEAFKQFALKWREEHEGANNAGKTAFIRGEGVDFKAVGATLKDIDQEVTRKMSKKDVLMMFDMPEGLLGVAGEKGLGRSEIESLEYVFMKHKIDPMMIRLDRIYRELAPMMAEGVIGITHESPVPNDKEFEHKQVKDLVNVVMTVNEARAQMGLTPMKDKQYDELKEERPKEPVKHVSLKKKATQKELDLKKNKEREDFRTRLMSTNDIYEIKVKRAISKFASAQEKSVISKITIKSKAFEEWLFEVKAESQAMYESVMPVLEELIGAQAKDTKNFITGETFEVTPEFRETVSSRVLQIAGVYNADTLTVLEESIAQGVGQGESLYKLKKRVEQIYQDAKGYRAERIARTESLRTSNMTAEQVYKQNGFSKIEWFTNPGACEFCKAFNGREKEIGQQFSSVGDVINGEDGGQLSVSYDDVGTPPLHPNCRCSIVPA